VQSSESRTVCSIDLKVDGWMLLVEVLSHVAPELGIGNMARCESLMVSYQNRPAVGKCLFWALGQAGVRNLSVGVKSNSLLFNKSLI
jgi:hypothetical protein